MTLDLWIPPEELPALPTRPATKAGSARALTCDLQHKQEERWQQNQTGK